MIPAKLVLALVDPNEDKIERASRASAHLMTAVMERADSELHRLDVELLDRCVDAALAEDVGSGDVTTTGTVDPSVRARGTLLARGAGCLSGLVVFEHVFRRLCTADDQLSVRVMAEDGDRITANQVLVELGGPAAKLLVGERTALNFIQRMSGIATLTAQFVEQAAGGARILDTRKTTPGLRAFEKYAVRCGGGENHRFGLYDEAMIKDNHLDLSGLELDALIEKLRGTRPGLWITAEARDEAEARAAARAGANVILLDNMSPAGIKRLCPILREEAGDRRVEIEASGGIGLENVSAYARTGVDRISIGALTHSAPALDLSLNLEPAK